ncbi:peptidoglycan DD-metalloendopeptidase family protein [Pararoseomonas sp. SCSIO 73927]|uniref:murein hydrolase activator EnvC family protein n=1 Tax=Pararoseomonas sp. SCSIO 73927 TaxID=3114537 RepID=UPI0030D2BE7D
MSPGGARAPFPQARRGGTLRLALLLGLIPSLVLAQPSRRALEEVERGARTARDEAAAIARDARTAEAAERALSARRAEAGRRAVAAEEAVAEAEGRLEAAAAAREAAEADLTRRAEALAPLIPAMRRLGLWPAETLLVIPAPPEEALRGALVLRGVAARLAREAAEYRAAKEEADRKTVVLEAERARLVAARAAAREAAEAVEAALAEARARREVARDAEDTATRRAADAAAGARDLRGAVERLEREARAREARERAEAERRERAAEAREREAAGRRQEAETRARENEARQAAREEQEARESAEAARERLREAAAPPRVSRGAPVAGSVQRAFGQGGANGQTWSAPAGARVVSPCGGRVVFSGPFRSYGRMLIVDCGGGYHFVLAGLDRLDAEPGQRVLAGEAVGTLGNAGVSGGGRATLYLELRRSGQPVDPAGWTSRG